MSPNATHEPNAEFEPNTTKRSSRGILVHSCESGAHETQAHKIKWDENKLKLSEKLKEQVQMKVDEPKTPFIRYDPVTDTITNIEVLPESLRAASIEEPDDFNLGMTDQEEETGDSILSQGHEEPDEWQKTDEKEQRDKEEAARKRHEEFERKRAQHYYHAGDVLHQHLPDE